MTRQLAVALTFGLVFSTAAAGQEPARAADAVKQAAARVAITALKVDVTIARTLNDKVVSSTPYTLSVIPDFKASLRMGGDVPVPTTTMTPAGEGKPATSLSSYGYRSIGTNIDVTASTFQEGQYRLYLVIDENSIYPIEVSPASKGLGAPSFRSFKSQNTILLRDGQSLEYTTATDRLSGEVFKVSVKMTVVK